MLITICTIILSGCASSGNHSLRNETEATVQTKIIEDKTTKSEIRKAFGSPNETSFTDNGKEIWKYLLVDASADGVNYIPIVNMFGSSVSGTRKELVILFDGDIVKKFSMSESAHSVRTGVFR